MLHLLRRTERSFLVACGLGLAAVAGWSSFAYSAWSSRQLVEQVGNLTAEHNAVLAKHQKLQHATGELDNTARLRSVKRDLARALTVARQRGVDPNSNTPTEATNG